jgi:hypothetical protein
LKEVKGEEQSRVEVSNRFAAFRVLDADMNINRTWERIRNNIKISANECLGYYEMNKPRFNKGCLKISDEGKQAKLQ